LEARAPPNIYRLLFERQLFLASVIYVAQNGARQRFYSMSAQIRLERQADYEMFERTQNCIQRKRLNGACA
jgi:hypothetical protein